MKWISAFIFAVFILTTGSANAQENNLKAGVQVWNVDISANDVDGDATFLGPFAIYHFPDEYWIKGSLLLGEEEYGPASTDVTTVDVIVGRAVSIMNFGVGFRYWNNDFSGGGSLSESGPIISVGIAHTFEPSSFKLYGDLTWNIIDFGDRGDTVHYTLEGGASYAIKQVELTAGYRFKHYYDFRDYTYKGITGSVAYRF